MERATYTTWVLPRALGRVLTPRPGDGRPGVDAAEGNVARLHRGAGEGHPCARQREPLVDAVVQSARTILAVVAPPIPAPLSGLLQEVADGASTDAWGLREKLCKVACDAFGAPGFHPLRV